MMGDSAKKAPLFRSIGKGRMRREAVDMPTVFGILTKRSAGLVQALDVLYLPRIVQNLQGLLQLNLQGSSN
jgi:hypothetical protein